MSFISPASFRVSVPTTDHCPWIEHAPFVSWLIDTLKPVRLVDISDELGPPYAAICQSVVASAAGTQCYVVDPKSGDGLAGPHQSSAIEKRFLSLNTHYQTFSRLVRVAFGRARDCFDDGSIDILHIDMKASYHRLKTTVEDWLPKMSRSGIVLLHNINSPETHRDTARFWEDWKRRSSHFEFPHARGLAVVAAGSDIHPALLGFFDRSNSRHSNSSLKNAYAQLGASVSPHYKDEFERLSKEIAGSDRLRIKLEMDLTDATRQRDNLQDALQRALARTSYLNALLGSQAFRLEEETQLKLQAVSELGRRARVEAVVDKDRIVTRLMTQSYTLGFGAPPAKIVDDEALLHRLAEQAYFGRAETPPPVHQSSLRLQTHPPGLGRLIVRRFRALAERIQSLTRPS